MSTTRTCSLCQTPHTPPTSRRCLRLRTDNMAEAFPDTQASSSLEISTETLERTITQIATLPIDEEGQEIIQQPQGKSVGTEQSINNVNSVGNVPVCDILKTLNSIALDLTLLNSRPVLIGTGYPNYVNT